MLAKKNLVSKHHPIVGVVEEEVKASSINVLIIRTFNIAENVFMQ